MIRRTVVSLLLYTSRWPSTPRPNRVLQPREVSLLRVCSLEYHSHGVLRAYRRRSTSSLVDSGCTCCQPDKSTNCNDCTDELCCSPASLVPSSLRTRGFNSSPRLRTRRVQVKREWRRGFTASTATWRYVVDPGNRVVALRGTAMRRRPRRRQRPPLLGKAVRRKDRPSGFVIHQSVLVCMTVYKSGTSYRTQFDIW